MVEAHPWIESDGVTGTVTESQEAVNAAEFLVALDSRRQYGLITGGPEGNIRRCHSLLRRGRNRGIHPREFAELVKLYIDAGTVEEGKTRQ
jgi:hypothetical protein